MRNLTFASILTLSSCKIVRDYIALRSPHRENKIFDLLIFISYYYAKMEEIAAPAITDPNPDLIVVFIFSLTLAKPIYIKF